MCVCVSVCREKGGRLLSGLCDDSPLVDGRKSEERREGERERDSRSRVSFQRTSLLVDSRLQLQQQQQQERRCCCSVCRRQMLLRLPFYLYPLVPHDNDVDVVVKIRTHLFRCHGDSRTRAIDCVARLTVYSTLSVVCTLMSVYCRSAPFRTFERQILAHKLLRESLSRRLRSPVRSIDRSSTR